MAKFKKGDKVKVNSYLLGICSDCYYESGVYGYWEFGDEPNVEYKITTITSIYSNKLGCYIVPICEHKNKRKQVLFTDIQKATEMEAILYG